MEYRGYDSVGVATKSDTEILVKFIGANFILFALVQILYAFKNHVPKPLIAMFQWTLFLPIGVLCVL